MARVLLVHTGHGWCFEHCAAGIRKYAPPEFVVLTPSSDEFEAVVKWSGPNGFGRLDAAFHFSYTSAPTLRKANAARYGCLLANMAPLYSGRAKDDGEDWNRRIVTAERNAEIAKDNLQLVDFAVCLNSSLWRHVSGLMDAPVAALPFGVDLEQFIPAPPRSGKGKFRVGWCGDMTHTPSVKGLKEIVEPLRASFGRRIEWEINDRSYRNPLNRRQMRQWYSSLDAFLTTSVNEGGPLPPFEAAACGVPVLGTDVGMLSDCKEFRRSGCLMPTYRDAGSAKRTVLAFQEALGLMLANRARRNRLGAIHRRCVERYYSWRALAPAWLYSMVVKEVPIVHAQAARAVSQAALEHKGQPGSSPFDPGNG